MVFVFALFHLLIRRRLKPRRPWAARTLRMMLGMCLGWAFGHSVSQAALHNECVEELCRVGADPWAITGCHVIT